MCGDPISAPRATGRKKHVWVSVSNDLVNDARRDLNDLGAADIRAHALPKIKWVLRL